MCALGFSDFEAASLPPISIDRRFSFEVPGNAAGPAMIVRCHSRRDAISLFRGSESARPPSADPFEIHLPPPQGRQAQPEERRNTLLLRLAGRRLRETLQYLDETQTNNLV